MNTEEMTIEQSDDDALAALMADDIDLDIDDDETNEDELTAAADLDLEEAIEEVADDETTEEVVAIADAEEIKEKSAKPKKARVSKTTGEPLAGQASFAALVSGIQLTTDETTPEEALIEIGGIVDSMAVKVTEKALNLFGFIQGNAKLSVYTEIAIKKLVQMDADELRLDAKTLVAHMQSQDENGVKGYSEGTARSQSYQMMKLLTALKICTDDRGSIAFNDDSPIADFLRSNYAS